MSIASQVITDRKSWCSHQHFAGFLDITHYTALGSQCRLVCDVEMTGDAHLAGDDAVLADLGGTGDAHLSRHHGIVPYFHVVRDLAEIVNFYPVSDDGRFHLRAVDGRTGSDFHIVADDHVADVFDLLPGAVWLRGVAETVSSGSRYPPLL